MSALNKRLKDGIEALEQGELERAEDLLDEVAVSPGGDAPIAGLEAEAEARFYKLLGGVAQRKNDIGLAMSALERQRALEDEAGVCLDEADDDGFDDDGFDDDDFDDANFSADGFDGDGGFDGDDVEVVAEATSDGSDNISGDDTDHTSSEDAWDDDDDWDDDASFDEDDAWDEASFDEAEAPEVIEAPAAEASHEGCACQQHAHEETDPMVALARAQSPTPVVMSGPDDSVRQTWMRYQKGDTSAASERTTTQTFRSGAYMDDEATYYADQVTTASTSSTHIVVGDGDALPEDVEAALGVDVNDPNRDWDECRIEEVRMLRTTLIYRTPHEERYREIQE